MKKILLSMILIFLLLTSFGCNQSDKKEFIDFFQNLTVENISNIVEIDGDIYSVYLSSNSSWVYYTMTTNNEHYILVKEERSFAYLMTDDMTLYDYYNNQKYQYIFDRQTLQLNKYEDNITTNSSTLNEDNLIDIVNYVKNDLNQTGDILMFDSLFTIISQTFRDVQTNEIELFGDSDFLISRSFDSGQFLTNISSFRIHISELYTQSQLVEISTSFENNPYGSVSVQVSWDSTNRILNPRFEILRNQLVFYTIDPLDQDYSIS